jgi:hypothetical protein
LTYEKKDRDRLRVLLEGGSEGEMEGPLQKNVKVNVRVRGVRGLTEGVKVDLGGLEDFDVWRMEVQRGPNELYLSK